MAKAYTGIERRTPYDRPQSGVFSKVKRMFSWSGKSDDDSRPQSNVTVNLNTPFKQTKQFAPGGWPSAFSTPAGNGSGAGSGAVDGAESPKPYFDTLAEFFKNKQHEPLSAIEVEGIISLIQKSKGDNEEDGGAVEVDVEVEKNSKKNEPDTQEIKSVKDVPLQEYHPRTESRSHLPIFASRRRVVEFSSLPSPYRMRLSSPLASLQEKRVLNKPNVSQAPSRAENFKVAKPAKKKMSKAASTLLSVLDSEESFEEVHDLKSIEERATKRVSRVVSKGLKELKEKELKEKELKEKELKEKERKEKELKNLESASKDTLTVSTNKTPMRPSESGGLNKLKKPVITSTPTSHTNGIIENEFKFPPPTSDIEFDPSQIDSSKVEQFCREFVFPSI